MDKLRGRKLKGARVLLLALGLLLVALAAYLSPKPLRSVVTAGDIDTHALAYCTVYDVSAQMSHNISEPTAELLAELFDGVLVSGPVLYANAAVNAEFLNLYLSLPLQGGGYRKVTVELISSCWQAQGVYDIFINVDNRGDMVMRGKEAVDAFMRAW